MEEKEIVDQNEDSGKHLALLLHGHVLETAKCRYKIFILENLLIKHKLTTREELDSLYDASLKEKLPEYFSKVEQTIGINKKLIFQEDGSIFIKSGNEK